MVRIRVPATSANMGPGFDSLGIALNIFNEYEFELIDEGIKFEGVEEQFKNDDNIILISMRKVFERYNFQYDGLRIKILKQDIPVSRGLGSSSSCIVAGLIGAYALMNKSISKDEIFKVATEIEGHPDNVCPAIYGGMVVSILEDDEAIYNKIKIADGIKFISLIPRFTLSTKEARAILPQEITLKDGIYNVGRVALLVSCFVSGNYKLLKSAMKDRFHEQYRSRLIKNYDKIYEYCYEIGALGCFLSGAGPTLMVICDSNDNNFITLINKYIKRENINWEIKELGIDTEGAKIISKT